jgi:hypothetical protein
MPLSSVGVSGSCERILIVKVARGVGALLRVTQL